MTNGVHIALFRFVKRTRRQMNKTSTKAILFAGLACPDGMTPRALADELGQRTIFTFNRSA